MMVTRPQTIGYSLVDSPVGLAAWMYEKFAQWTYSGGEPERSLTRDEMLDDISLYWLTDTAISSAQIYWEDHSNNFNAVDIAMPVAVTVFPGEIYRAPRELGRTRLPQPHLLQRGRQRRPLRRVGGARALHRRGAGRLPVAAADIETLTAQASPYSNECAIPTSGWL